MKPKEKLRRAQGSLRLRRGTYANVPSLKENDVEELTAEFIECKELLLGLFVLSTTILASALACERSRNMGRVSAQTPTLTGLTNRNFDER